MRLLMTFLLIAVCAGSVCANNFYQNNNPFPVKTGQPEFNNIYATEPQAEAEEEKTEKKMGFWGRKNKTKNIVKEDVNTTKEGIQGTSDGSFYVFPAK